MLVDRARRTMAAQCARSSRTSLAHEQLNPGRSVAGDRAPGRVWLDRGSDRLSLWPCRFARFSKLRLLANVLPAMLDQMAKGDMPNESQLRTIAAASLDDQKEVWKKHKPSKADPQVSWWSVAQAPAEDPHVCPAMPASTTNSRRPTALPGSRTCSHRPIEDSRYTTDVEAFLGAQQEWMTAEPAQEGGHLRDQRIGARSEAAEEGGTRLWQADAGPTIRHRDLPRSRGQACRRCTSACRRRRSRRARANNRSGRGHVTMSAIVVEDRAPMLPARASR